jgi:uncharacterized pyridoxamine 5'-phosphate oxidase family protein
MNANRDFIGDLCASLDLSYCRLCGDCWSINSILLTQHTYIVDDPLPLFKEMYDSKHRDDLKLLYVSELNATVGAMLAASVYNGVVSSL